MAFHESKPRKGKRRRVKFNADEMHDWYTDLWDEFPPSPLCPEDRTNFKTVTYVPLADLKALAAAVRAHNRAVIDAESMLPEQETDWPDGYDFKELEKVNAVEDLARARLNRLLSRAEGGKDGTCATCKHCIHDKKHNRRYCKKRVNGATYDDVPASGAGFCYMYEVSR